MDARLRYLSVAAGAALGILYFVTYIGWWRVDPGNYQWVMNGSDRRWHQIAWQAFRREPWQWPPGKLVSLRYPVGTSIANTDGLPLLAVALKPWNALLSQDFQYFGAWALLCAVLHGTFAAMLMSLSGGGWLFQLLGVGLLLWNPLAMPMLDHPARAASGWGVLAGLWLYFRPAQSVSRRHELYAWLALCIAAASIHAYVCVMVLALAAAGITRRWWPDRALSLPQAALGLAAVVVCVVLTWWLHGYFVVRRSGDIVTHPLGIWSMNLVAPINPVYWSRFLPELKLASDLQQGEGFAYFGLGILLLALGGAVAALVRPPARATVNALTPVLLTTGVLLLVAISPKVTFGSHVLFELPQVLYAPFAPFRASGRFVLPAFYLMLFLLLWLVAHRLPGWAASAVLIVVLWVQLADIGGRLNGIRDQAARGAELHVWKQPLSWEAWRFATDSYRRMLLVPPDDWDHEKALPFAYLAARSGMATTAGYAARSDKAAMQAARRRLKEQLVAGELDRDAVYIVDARYLSQFQQNFGDRVSCRVVDGFDACIPR